MKNLVKELGIKGSKFHRALSDSLFCMELFLKCINKIGINDKIIEKLFNSNKGKYKSSNELTLCWKDILLKRNLEKIIASIEEKLEIEIQYPVIKNLYGKANE